MPEVVACGERIEYEVVGDGEPLLFFHAEHGPVRSVSFLKHLGERARVIAPTLPGFGDSARPTWLTTVDDMAFDLLEFLDAIKEQQVHVVGESLGGWIALDFAARYRDRVRSLVVVNSMGLHAGTEEFADVFHLPDDEVRARSFHTTPPELEDFLSQARSDAMTARLGWHPRFFDPKLSHRLHRATMPSLVINGEHDGIVPAACADRIAEALPHARRATIASAAHFATYDQPEALAEMIVEFFDSIR